MILFKPEHVGPILAGRKTQTRRLGERRWNVGSAHLAATRLFDPTAVFARLRILDVRRDVLWQITPEDVRAEGYRSLEEFAAAFERINGPAAFDTPVWVVSFALAERLSMTDADRKAYDSGAWLGRLA